MIKSARENVHMALYSEAVLEEGNDQLHRLPDKAFHGAFAYDIIQLALAKDLCISLSRLFDSGSKHYPPNKRDVSSIPLLVRLVKQKRCRKQLIQRSQTWSLGTTPDQSQARCTGAIEMALEHYTNFMTTIGPSRLASLRRFRNEQLAHSFIKETEGGYPRFREVFQLVEVAAFVVRQVSIADHDSISDPLNARSAARHAAKLFWRQALSR